MSGTSMLEQGGAASATLLIERGQDLMSATTSFLAGLGESVFAVGNTELGPLFRQVDDLKRQVEAAQVITLSEALGRGVVAESDCPTATSWVLHWAPSFRSGGAAQLVTVTHATRAVRNAALAAAVLTARVGVRNAAVALAEMEKLKPRLGTRPPSGCGRRSGRCSSRSAPTTDPKRSACYGTCSSPSTASKATSNAATTSSNTGCRCPSRPTTTG